jgi:hypothetical protein
MEVCIRMCDDLRNSAAITKTDKFQDERCNEISWWMTQ